MTTLDRLRELVRNTRRPPPRGASAGSAGARSETASAFTDDGGPASASAAFRGAASGVTHGLTMRAGESAAIRELVYEQVDAAGLPMPSRDELPALPGAAICDTPLGRCIVIDRVFEGDRLHGRIRVEDACIPATEVIGFCEAQALARDPALSPGAVASLEADADEGPVLFLDLETTGLSGGAGTVAFLVGCGYFERGAFRTRQFLLPGFAGERALLHAVASCLNEAGCLVTYNGSTFDLPVMETRWLFHRQPVAWSDLTHLDMVHVSRRLWRARGDESEASCRLVYLERDLFGVMRVGDVPGFEIPGRYFEYIRHGNASLLEPVLHHNRLDLLSLALLTARAITLVREGLAATADPQEWLAVGRELVRMNRAARAEACFRAVADAPTAGDALRAEALYAWARLLRRGRRYREAAEVWRRLVACGAARAVLRAEAHEALAVHYEHRDRDLEEAHEWASSAYAVGTHRQQDAVAHRLARLRRKLSVQAKGGPKTALPLPW